MPRPRQLRPVALLALLAATACGAAGQDRLGAAPPPDPPALAPGAAPGPAPTARVLLPPRPEDLGPDGDLLPGTPAYVERERALAEYEAMKQSHLAQARALAPEADAFATADPRTADLLSGATYDPVDVLPVGDGTSVTGVALTYALPAPREVRVDRRLLDLPLTDEIAVVVTSGTTRVEVQVDVRQRLLRHVSALDGTSATAFDAEGRRLSPRPSGD